MSSHLKAELAATCSTLGRLHKGEYLIEPECFESVKDLIRYLKRDDESHSIRRYLGESKILQNDLIHVMKSCPSENAELFDVTLRLLINLTTPTMLFYGEEIPAEKIGRNIYLSLVGYLQEYKIAFYDVDFWNKICGKLTNLFETDWAERSADDGIQIERILMLLRNVLQVPADAEGEKRPENDITIHDKVLWALRQSQILELLLFVSSNHNEEQYYLNLLEIFSLILREQNPKVLAQCDVQRSTAEKTKDTDDLIKVREMEKRSQNKYLNMRNFNATFVMKGVKSFANNDIVCHRSLDKVNSLDVTNLNKKQVRARRNRIPVESERVERRSTFSVRLFLKEFSLEFLNCGFSHLMNVVKNRLDSGKSLAHDQSYYFWALQFFLDFVAASDLDVNLIKDCLATESFHFVQTSMDNAFEHLVADKKKTVDWVKRIHLILKAYHSLLETLLWMDCHKNPLVRSISREIKSEIFYVVEYREMTLHVLLRYDQTKFSVSYLKDLIETIHLFIKLLEEFSKQTKLVVQKVTRKKSTKKKRKTEEVIETKEEKWEKIKDDVYDILSCESAFPEIPPFDAALDIPIDDQKGRAMKNIQRLLHSGEIRNGIGLLRSARQVWPENDHFGSETMSVEDETMALQEICLADLGEVDEGNKENDKPKSDDEEEEEEPEEERVRVVEQDFSIMDYKKRLVNKKVVEGCGMLLKNYKKNSDHTNHCAIKLLHRIGWECCMPAMLYQASLFWTLLKIMNDKSKTYNEINTFTVNLLRRFRKHAVKNPVVFLELLFWKENNVALEIQHGYEPYEDKEKPKRRSKKNKPREESDGMSEEHPEGLELGDDTGKRLGKKKKDGGKKPQKSRKNKSDMPTDFEDISDLRDENLLTNSIMSDCESDISENEAENQSGDGLSANRSFQKSLMLNSSDGDEAERKSQKSRKKKTMKDDSMDLLTKSVTSYAHDMSEKGTDAAEDQSNDKLISNRSCRKSMTKKKNGEPGKESRNRRKKKSQVKGGLYVGNESLSIKFSENSQKSAETSENQSGDELTAKSSSRKSIMLNSSDEEEPEKINRQRKLYDSSENDEDINCRKPERKIQSQKDETLSSPTNSSSQSSKKRSREDLPAEEAPNDSYHSKSKRVRYIGSDSGMGAYHSDEETPVVTKKNRKRLAVIDSDSDENDAEVDKK